MNWGKVYIAGHKGLVGAALIRRLKKESDCEILTADKQTLDLRDQNAVRKFFATHKPDYVCLAAAKVGGIHANNTYPADFIYDNIMMEANVIHESYRLKIKQLLFLGSSCIYPALAEQPIKESAILTGKLEQTNEPYALAKIAGIKLCESYNRQYGTDFRSVMPTNLFGPGDNYHQENSHVIPALIRRIHEAKVKNIPRVSVWGSGTPRREFLYVDDLADACIFLMKLSKETYQENTQDMLSHINVGTGRDISIADLANKIVATVGYKGQIIYDLGRKDGAPRKLLDVGKIHKLGWTHKTSLLSGLHRAYEDYLRTVKQPL